MSTPLTWRLELGTPGAMRDRLVAAVLDGTKTASTLIRSQLPAGDDALPRPGQRYPLIDSASDVAGQVQLDAVAPTRLADVTMEHVRDDGARFETVAQWRAAHVGAWEALTTSSPETFGDDTVVFALRFHVVGAASD